MIAQGHKAAERHIPRWVPEAARHYLVHTEAGLSIRALAREKNCHPSTVLRQVRRFEGRRDDPLIDAALTSLSTNVARANQDQKGEIGTMNNECWNGQMGQTADLTQDRIDQEARRVLRRLCEQGAVLAVVPTLETSVVVREAADGEQLRTAVVDREIAQAMALKEWIVCPDPSGRVARYFITNRGRAALRRLLAEDENRAGGFAEKRRDFAGDDDWDVLSIDTSAQQANKNYATESPLVGLARRKGQDGKPFLDRAIVSAGERLREDYELAQVGVATKIDWEALIAQPDRTFSNEGPPGSIAARDRVLAAVDELGPGLGDVALRCCCFLEGLEVTEKKMGWSARSGKIVLRIALQRLVRHYDETQGKFGPMIG